VTLSGHTVLVTGGASGIGLALATRFARAGSEVIVCGRRHSQLDAAKALVPGVQTRAVDLSRAESRESFCAGMIRDFPALDVLINNAGIQRYPKLTETEPWAETAQEIAINLEAPIHLSRLLVPQLRGRPGAAIINVTSGLSFAPLAHAPIYSATKAALHSFTLSLRHQLAAAGILVIEIIPPAVDTDLGGPGRHTFGVNVESFADDVMTRIAAGEIEVAHGFAAASSRASREELDAMFTRMNAPRQ